MNEFISMTTEGKIKDFMPEDIVSGAHSLVINTIYFEAKWEQDSSEGSTISRTFRSTGNVQKEVTENFLEDSQQNKDRQERWPNGEENEQIIDIMMAVIR
ncbi:hypothetical protein ANCCAN_25382 [Ancylostoma caninum]|uniref:Serpin domain-containing protein n=1 Tax=Ancylostoma caninum TaxID=29170 RepID=A0A368FDB3_ANCCA|nr:hypothetical protein ANCCAN_25382 [Ancylostoma caninum]